MVLIQILLPANVTGDEKPHHALTQTTRELSESLGGTTAYVRSPAKGRWTSEAGRTEEDDMVMVEVVADRFDREWWQPYAVTLAARFRQDLIHVRALPVELLNPDAS